jgi:hypothetical protein
MLEEEECQSITGAGLQKTRTGQIYFKYLSVRISM